MAINDNGNINPLAREVILMGWNLVNGNNNNNKKLEIFLKNVFLF